MDEGRRVEVEEGRRVEEQVVQVQVQVQVNLRINIQWIIVNEFLFWKKTIYLWTMGEEWRCRGSKSKSKVEDRLTDNIFAYDTLYILKKQKWTLWTQG